MGPTCPDDYTPPLLATYHPWGFLLWKSDWSALETFPAVSSREHGKCNAVLQRGGVVCNR
eukprot:502762-Prymnesium_polylepis.1